MATAKTRLPVTLRTRCLGAWGTILGTDLTPETNAGPGRVVPDGLDPPFSRKEPTASNTAPRDVVFAQTRAKDGSGERCARVLLQANRSTDARRHPIRETAEQPVVLC